MEDFIIPLWKRRTQKQMTWLNMGLSVFFGGLCIGMAGVASSMGSVLQAALSIFGMISGPLLGLYLLGMFFHTPNSIGSLSGMIIGLVLTLWVGIGAQIYPPTADKTLPLSVTTVGCNSTIIQNHTTQAPWTSTVPMTTLPSVRPPLADSWYSLSYLYFAVLGTLVTIVSGFLISMATGGCKQEKLHPDLFVKKSDLFCFSGCNTSEASHAKEKKISDAQGIDNKAFTDLPPEIISTDKEMTTKL